MINHLVKYKIRKVREKWAIENCEEIVEGIHRLYKNKISNISTDAKNNIVIESNAIVIEPKKYAKDFFKDN